MSDSLSYHLWNNGVVIRHGEEIERVEATEDAVVVHLKSGKKMRADCLLFANGRTGNTADLNLEAAGLKADGRGQLKVNDATKLKLRISLLWAMLLVIQA